MCILICLKSIKYTNGSLTCLGRLTRRRFFASTCLDEESHIVTGKIFCYTMKVPMLENEARLFLMSPAYQYLSSMVYFETEEGDRSGKRKMLRDPHATSGYLVWNYRSKTMTY